MIEAGSRDSQGLRVSMRAQGFLCWVESTRCLEGLAERSFDRHQHVGSSPRKIMPDGDAACLECYSFQSFTSLTYDLPPPFTSAWGGGKGKGKGLTCPLCDSLSHLSTLASLPTGASRRQHGAVVRRGLKLCLGSQLQSPAGYKLFSFKVYFNYVFVHMCT